MRNDTAHAHFKKDYEDLAHANGINEEDLVAQLCALLKAEAIAPAASATSNADARPMVDPHGNGVRIGESGVPAQAAPAPALVPRAPTLASTPAPAPTPTPVPTVATPPIGCRSTGTSPAQPPAVGKACSSDVTGDGANATLPLALRASKGNGASGTIHEMHNHTRNHGDSTGAGGLQLSKCKPVLFGGSLGSGSCNDFQCGPLLTEEDIAELLRSNACLPQIGANELCLRSTSHEGCTRSGLERDSASANTRADPAPDGRADSGTDVCDNPGVVAFSDSVVDGRAASIAYVHVLSVANASVGSIVDSRAASDIYGCADPIGRDDPGAIARSGFVGNDRTMSAADVCSESVVNGHIAPVVDGRAESAANASADPAANAFADPVADERAASGGDGGVVSVAHGRVASAVNGRTASVSDASVCPVGNARSGPVADNRSNSVVDDRAS